VYESNLCELLFVFVWLSLQICDLIVLSINRFLEENDSEEERESTKENKARANTKVKRVKKITTANTMTTDEVCK